MRVLVLHSDVSPDAPADEQDTLIAAQAVAEALQARGHLAAIAPFVPDPQAVRALLAEHRPDAVFNMVETVFGQGDLAPIAPAILENLHVPFTGCRAAPMALAGDKPLAKGVLRAAGLPTPDWAEAPFDSLPGDGRWIVKSATEDASLGLDDGAVVAAGDAVRERAAFCRRTYGGRWFAEAYVEGREFNVSVIEENNAPRVLPVAEMTFENWPADHPRVVGYAAKWEPDSKDSRTTVRCFFGENAESALLRALSELTVAAWRPFGLKGFARVDFRVDREGKPTILEINPNPGLAPDAGFAAAAAKAGVAYPNLVERILRQAKR